MNGNLNDRTYVTNSEIVNAYNASSSWFDVCQMTLTKGLWFVEYNAVLSGVSNEEAIMAVDVLNTGYYVVRSKLAVFACYIVDIKSNSTVNAHVYRGTMYHTDITYNIYGAAFKLK